MCSIVLDGEMLDLVFQRVRQCFISGILVSEVGISTFCRNLNAQQNTGGRWRIDVGHVRMPVSFRITQPAYRLTIHDDVGELGHIAVLDLCPGAL